MSDTERKRRQRDRLRNGCLFTVADVPAEFVERLIDLGYLTDDGSGDARQRGAALVKYLLAARVLAST